jgi:stearoyl-CoA desaturase (delta-9 desaturase)
MLRQWFDSDFRPEGWNAETDLKEGVDWKRCIPFIVLHLGCFAVLWVGFSWVALVAALLLYAVRMFAITAFYHRYFSHRSYRTSRAMQFLFAVLGNTSCQRGPLWWASVHRHHHQHSDDDPGRAFAGETRLHVVAHRLAHQCEELPDGLQPRA